MKFLRATTEHMLQIKRWFHHFDEIQRWGGPELTYPIEDQTFTELLQAPHFNSYAMLDENNQVMAFGQHYIRLERHHLARLVVNPNNRGQGLGQVLVKQLLDIAIGLHTAQSASLFVFEDNLAAYHCYQKLGFVETDYPGGVPGNMKDCVYMVKVNRD
ncbi:GNAT family N-acetyltransferase [Paraglaciecola aquimarina]|uniref:GNAT family N-acetyltransferase n=1 Tax=Paraglaciecola algarum TaxID=3050085 RepID=A0ABS9DB68_9ALTE|nr:GNAT family N-acetyltransferase [Paraglaciecola sp. G1-23]MCF2949044.1 GNAT family N-acetyltransferase [Paraglaciecola sp. G1-23]